MKVTYKADDCILIDFTENSLELRKQGWLGDEEQARLYKADGILEIRVFKRNGESYVLSEDSKDQMVRMKARKLKDVAKNA